MNNGNGFHEPSVAYPDGRVDRACQAFAPEHVPLLVHEFSLSFVNPKVKSAYRSYAGADHVYADAAQQMQHQAYPKSRVMVDESLARAGVILYMEAHGATAAEVAKGIDYERPLGFAWMSDLVGLLRRYMAEQDRYPTFASFVPEVEEFFDDWNMRTMPGAATSANQKQKPQS